VASLSYVYNRNTRELPKRLSTAFQDHHHLSVATMRVTLDHESCMEVSVLKGATAEVEVFAESIRCRLNVGGNR
jgi:CopG family nickel-responsive transcriptional regulator